jgi:hypothetical protein
MIINFDLESIYKDTKLFYGNKDRYSSLTGVIFISSNLLVACSYFNRRIYLIHFDLEKNTYEILHTINTINSKREKVVSDLLDYNGKYIVTSNLVDCSISLYYIIDNKLHYKKTITNKNLGLCHGISFHPSVKDIVFFTTSGTKNPNCGIYGLNTIDNKIIVSVTENNLLAKDVCFSVDGNKMYGIYSESAPSGIEKRVYSGKLVIYNINLQSEKNKIIKKSELLLLNCHVDAIKVKDDKIYITAQELDADGYIYELIENDEKIILLNKFGNYDFPHGIDINFDMLGVTEYGKNCLNIMYYDKLIEF